MEYYSMLGKEPPLPKLGEAQYLFMHLQALGYYTNTGMGLSPLSYTEIKAYCDLTGNEFTPDEVTIIRNMSQLYVNQSHDKNPNAKAPYNSVD
jgi:hypothetical protein